MLQEKELGGIGARCRSKWVSDREGGIGVNEWRRRFVGRRRLLRVGRGGLVGRSNKLAAPFHNVLIAGGELTFLGGGGGSLHRPQHLQHCRMEDRVQHDRHTQDALARRRHSRRKPSRSRGSSSTRRRADSLRRSLPRSRLPVRGWRPAGGRRTAWRRLVWAGGARQRQAVWRPQVGGT